MAERNANTQILQSLIIDARPLIAKVNQIVVDLGYERATFVNYFQNNVTMKFWRSNLEGNTLSDIPEIQELVRTTPNMSLDYVLRIHNATSANQLQKYIIGKLGGLTFNDRKRIQISTTFHRIMIPGDMYKKMKNKDLINMYFKCEEDDNAIAVRYVGEHMFELQKEFLIQQ